MLEDKLLVWKINRGNPDALRRIYQKYKGDLLTLAAALLFDKTEAEDCLHDCFISFIKGSQQFQLTGSLKGYLSTCIANNARNRNKARQKHQNVGMEQTKQATSDSHNPDYSAIFGEDLQRLSWALYQLPYDQREVILLRHYSSMKFRTIAKLQDLSINTIQGRYRYGLDKLRSLLDSEVQK
jgi:RNA polymerase sigma-70 factor (ECF subfamily)